MKRVLPGSFVYFASALNMLVAQDLRPADSNLPTAMQQALARIAKGKTTFVEQHRAGIPVTTSGPHACSAAGNANRQSGAVHYNARALGTFPRCYAVARFARPTVRHK